VPGPDALLQAIIALLVSSGGNAFLRSQPFAARASSTR
jgi:hypothetical protein